MSGLTQPSEFEHPSEGYIVIAPLSTESKLRISAIQSRYVEQFGEDTLWLPKDDQLHITFSHIITPNVEYAEDHAALFARLQPLASVALSEIAKPPFAISSHFNTIEAFPSAVILKATDDGTYDKLRKRFVERFLQFTSVKWGLSPSYQLVVLDTGNTKGIHFRYD
ncbi:MAG TPA: hypothetical protein VJR27_01755 [Candidatus Saccharimonadales bacterium]|nr:hypothetical protein [Candidatus Saccharimonadales bacterium]